MNAPISEDDLHAWADRRLDASRRAEIDRWLDAHPEARTQAEQWRAQNAAFHHAYDALLEQPVPARLLESVKTQGTSLRFSLLRVAAVLAWMVLGGVIGFALRDAMAPGNAAMASLPRQAAIAHAVFSPEVRHPVEVAAAQEAHLIAWLSKRLGTQLKPPHLDGTGFSLIGGRLLPDTGSNSAVAQFMYQDDRGQRLTLYVRHGADLDRQTAFRFAQEKNIAVFYWVDGGLGYALSGELPKEEMLHIATQAYRQLNP
jgi:anti-sigma factor RsiW